MIPPPPIKECDTDEQDDADADWEDQPWTIDDNWPQSFYMLTI